MAKAPKEKEVPKTHNLDDEQMQALFMQNTGKYKKALEAKKKADADLRNLGKIIKSDHGDIGLDMIKLGIKLEDADDDQENKEKEKVIQTLRVMRWAGIPIGIQGDLFTPFDDRPLEERAFEAGRAAGMNSESMKPPMEMVGTQGPAFEEWCRGWHLGQEKIFSIRKTGTKDAEEAGKKGSSLN